MEIGKGVRQGCVLSPYLFNIISESALRKALEGYKGGVSIGGRRITNLRYADDIVLLASTVQELQDLVNRVSTCGKEYNLRMNVDKTKVMALNAEVIKIQIDGTNVEQVSKFPYLGSVITDNTTCEADFRHRLVLGSTVLAKLKPLWQSHSLTLKTKIRLCKALVWPVVSYGSEGWILRKEEEKKLEAFEMKMLRRVLGVTWQEHRTNESILQTTGYVKDLVLSIKRKKLTYAGHVVRSHESLEKVIMQGRVPGKRGRGRPRKSWMDDITTWTGLSAEKVGRAALDRSKWRKVVRDAA